MPSQSISAQSVSQSPVLPILKGNNSKHFQMDITEFGGRITKYIGPKTEKIVIPSTIDGIQIVEIGNRAFSGCADLTSLTIPDSITIIGNSAFKGCTNLTLHVLSGSYAEKYAKIGRIPYQITNFSQISANPISQGEPELIPVPMQQSQLKQPLKQQSRNNVDFWEQVQKKLSPAHLERIEKAGWTEYQEHPAYQCFVQKVRSAKALVLCNSGGFHQRNKLYLYYEESKSVQQLTKDGENIIAFDVKNDDIYALLTFYDFDSGQEKYCIKSFTFREGLPILRKFLYHGEIVEAVEATSSPTFIKGNLRVLENNLLISCALFDGPTTLLSFSLETHSIETSSIFGDFNIDEFDVFRNQVWAISSNRLLCWEQNRGLIVVASLDRKIYGLQVESAHFLPYYLNCDTLISFCFDENGKTTFQQIAVEKSQKKNIHIIYRGERAYLSNDFFVSFMKHEEYGDGYTRIIVSESDDETSCGNCTFDDFSVKRYCLLNNRLFLSVGDIFSSNRLYVVNLTEDYEVAEINTDKASFLEDQAYKRLVSILREEERAYRDWEAIPAPVNPAHSDACKRLSQYCLLIDNYGSCHIVNCTRKASDIITVLLSDGQKRTFSTSILGKTAKVENDPTGQFTADLIELVNTTLECPEYLPKKNYKSKHIPWTDEYQRISTNSVDTFHYLSQFNSYKLKKSLKQSLSADSHKSKLDEQVQMYVILENEHMLGLLDRSDQEFFSAYKDCFPDYTLQELSALHELVCKNILDPDFCEYYNNVWKEYPVQKRFQFVVQTLFDQYDEYSDNFTFDDQAQFAIEHTKQWFAYDEHQTVKNLMNAYLQKQWEDIQTQIDALPEDWQDFSSARPYLYISKSETNCESGDPFHAPLNNFDSALEEVESCQVELRAHGTTIFLLTAKINAGISWFWGASVSDIWVAAIKNMLLLENYNAETIDPYCKAAAKMLAKYGDSENNFN